MIWGEVIIMRNYKIKCFVLSPSNNLLKEIHNLIIDYNFIIDKGWENGHHLILRGKLPDAYLSKVISSLEEGTDESIVEYNTNEFIDKYKDINNLLYKNESFLVPIIKNQVLSFPEDEIFGDTMLDDLFMEINNIIDRYFFENYFKKNSLHKIIEEIYTFHSLLEAHEKYQSTDAYNCHLSHYVAFIHKLNESDKNKIEYEFNNKFINEMENGSFEFEKKATKLTDDLLGFYYKIRSLVHNKKLDFYMPFDRSYIEKNWNYASSRHKETFSEKNIENHLYNDVLIVNRWITNALYKKILLMNFTNLDRFYMNYSISRLVYPPHELKDY